MDITDNLPNSVEAVVEKMMEKDPQDRYEGMGALLTDLRSMRSAASIHTKKRSPSIAVLPFANMSADPDQEYFCDGLAEELINALTQLRDLRVIARTSAFSFKGRDVNVRDIGKELRVESVLEGSVRKVGNRLRVTAQLVDTVEGHHLWSERFDREMEDVFAIQDDITSAIVDNLKPMLMDQEEARLRKRQPVDLGAYNLYLRGLWFWNKQNVDGFEKAIEYFTQAIEKDAECAFAYSGLACTFAALPYYSPSPPRDAFQKAREAALKALEIDDTIGEAHTSLAIVKTIYDWDWEGAEKEHRRALELNSGLAAGHISYAFFLLCMDSLDEATKEIETALDLDPLSLFINRLAGEYLLHARQYDRAIEVMQKAIEMDPSLPVAHSNLGQVYFAMGRFEEALAEFEKEKAFSKGWGTFNDAWIGGTLAMLGRVDESQKILRDLLERAKRESVPTFFLASVYFMRGETDKAFELLEKAYDERDPWMWALKVAQSHEFMRSDPRGKAILKKMGLDR